jgi:hypothetical protein
MDGMNRSRLAARFAAILLSSTCLTPLHLTGSSARALGNAIADQTGSGPWRANPASFERRR